MHVPAAKVRAWPPSASAASIIRIARWALPVALFAVAVFFEWGEHVRGDGDAISAAFYTEVVVFGLLGPAAVFATLTLVVRLIDAYVRTSDELAAVNRDLETRIAQRTQHLSLATAQLAEANEELAEANEELRELDGLKSEFVSLVSHQLRAPLTNIRGALELVEGSADALPASARRPLQILSIEADHLAGLVTKILDISRLEAGHLSASLGPVALEPLLARACSAALGPENGGRWVLSAAPGLPPAWADEALLEEVVRNLLHNASVHAPSTLPIEVRATIGEGAVRIAVDDHGPGVPAEEQARIFQSFHRVGDRDTTTNGYGLGLYFADKLVAAMGGTIGVTSPLWPDAAAPGARFEVALAVAPEEPPGQDEAEED